MTDTHEEIEGLAAEIDRMAEEKPYAANLLRAFGPLVLGQQRWLATMEETTGTCPVDPIRYQSGLSLMQQCRVLLPEDPWQEAGLAVAEAIGQGFGQFSPDMLRLAQRIREKPSECFALCEATDDEQLADQAKQQGMASVSLQFFRSQLRRWMLAKKARDMRAGIASLSWKKGYCPICGSFPYLAVIREQGQRWLQCSTCNHQWLFPRLTCPYCDHEDPQETHTLFVVGRQEEFAFTCGQCSRYLLTCNQSGHLRQRHNDLLALSLVHLDYILQEKGLLPMAVGVFNTFCPIDGVG